MVPESVDQPWELNNFSRWITSTTGTSQCSVRQWACRAGSPSARCQRTMASTRTATTVASRSRQCSVARWLNYRAHYDVALPLLAPFIEEFGYPPPDAD